MAFELKCVLTVTLVFASNSVSFGDTIYGYDETNDSIVTIDTNTLTVTPKILSVGMPSNRALGMTIDNSGTIWALPTIFTSASNFEVHKIDPVLGPQGTSPTISYPVNSEVGGLESDPNGDFYSIQLGSTLPGGGSPAVLDLDLVSGAIDSTTALSQTESISGLTRAPDGTYYALNAASNRLLTLDPTTGNILTMGPFQASFNAAIGLVYANDGQLYTANLSRQGAAANELVRIDPSTGIGTVVGSLGTHSIGAMARISSIPEPSLFLVWSLASVAAVRLVRNRR